MYKKVLPLISILLIAVFVLAACQPAATPTAAPAEDTGTGEMAFPTDPITITLWTKEGETDGALQYVQALTAAYTEQHSNVTFEVVNKEVETLREDFQTSSLAGAAPDLLWTVSDHLGPFTAADLIQPVADKFDLSQFVQSATDAVTSPDGQVWGVPISNGNHVMLIYNKSLLPEPPKNTDELISMGKDFMSSHPDEYALVYNQTEPFFMIAWLGGYGGKVFADDGVTPTLDTPEMVKALQFLHDIKYVDGLVPAESDYDGADSLFKEGKAAMIINGDWSLGAYKEALGDNLGVAPIPMVSETGKYPAPYTSGVFFMLPKDLSGDKLTVVKDFINFVTSKDQQIDMVKKLSRLPANKEALNDAVITNDPILSGSALQMSYGTPMPTVVEMRCVWDSLKPEMQAVFADTESAQDAATKAQSAATTCISQLE
ncbi:MAG TPA: extracellular solute-binding protein [Bellilinea sp.]|jgi:arabinogalactan oligomer/maltooligosaccharide transport system substrate-binding protein|nr:extracellular solute-binding protein [Bellilinea sp.]